MKIWYLTAGLSGPGPVLHFLHEHGCSVMWWDSAPQLGFSTIRSAAHCPPLSLRTEGLPSAAGTALSHEGV